MNEADYEKLMNGSFGQCLGYLLRVDGARPPSSKKMQGEMWSTKELAGDLDLTARAVRDWLADRKKPRDLVAIERALFDPEEHSDRRKLVLRHTYSSAKKQEVTDSKSEIIKRRHPTEVNDRKVQVARMPTTSGDKLFGREAELDLLDSTWADGEINILTFIAMGGTGKTALVSHWLGRMQQDDWCGAENIYTWSFYSQGVREDRQASADPFFEHALRWFGYTGQPITSNWERGLKLAELIAARRTLLILDGLEPLQYPPGEMQGRLKDQGLQALLRQLSRLGQGLCIITTRVAIAELADQKSGTAISHDLGNLSYEDGMALLRHLGVTSADKELFEAVSDFGRHALALSLLGKYIVAVYEGDIIHRFKEPNLQKAVPGLGGHAERVMSSYENWLKQHNKVELSILFMMGLFDRPAPAGAIDALRKEPAIPEITDVLSSIANPEWQFALKHLKELHLLNPTGDIEGNDLDAHPLVREYFGARLKNQNHEAWRRAHERLYEYYKALPEKELPDTAQEMEPLISAINHGCYAGKFQETFDKIYWPRVRRKDDHYNLHDLGMFGDDIGVLGNYFEIPWTKVNSSLRRYNQAEIANWAGYCLQSLGRLGESAPLMKLSLQIFADEENEWEAALVASVVSGIYLALGETKDAFLSAELSVAHFLKIEEDTERLDRNYSPATFYTILAETLHQLGKLHEAEEQFRSAINVKNTYNSELPLESLSGFRYWDFCLSKGQVAIALEEAKIIMDNSNSINLSVLGKALCLLTIGNALVDHHSSEIIEGDEQAADYLGDACSLLRKSEILDHLPRGHLQRSKYLIRLGKFSDAQSDLLEAFDVASRGGMLLHLADCHLLSARLALAMDGVRGKVVLDEAQENPPKTPEQHIKVAADLIEKTDYGRRKPDLALLRARLSIAKREEREAQNQLGIVAQYIDEGWKIHEVEHTELTKLVQSG